jgi:hypothetical protein
MFTFDKVQLTAFTLQLRLCKHVAWAASRVCFKPIPVPKSHQLMLSNVEWDAAGAEYRPSFQRHHALTQLLLRTGALDLQ